METENKEKKRIWVGKNPLICTRSNPILPREICNSLKSGDGVNKPAVVHSYMDEQEGTVLLINRKAFDKIKDKVPPHIAKALKPVEFKD